MPTAVYHRVRTLLKDDPDAMNMYINCGHSEWCYQRINQVEICCGAGIVIGWPDLSAESFKKYSQETKEIWQRVYRAILNAVDIVAFPEDYVRDRRLTNLSAYIVPRFQGAVIPFLEEFGWVKVNKFYNRNGGNLIEIWQKTRKK